MGGGAVQSMASKRRIAVVSGSRADFGLLRPVLEAIQAEKALALHLILTGTHLTNGTWADAARAGFARALRVPMQQPHRIGRGADVEALGRGIEGLGQAFARVHAQIVLVLGDRIEALAAACAAHVGGIHLAHIHGGDRAEGVADEAMRHAISKLAHIHLAATAQSRRRLIRMGESPRWVFNVGSPAVDGLKAIRRPGQTPGPIIVMQHPIGASDACEARWMRATLDATRGRARVLMAPNGDPGSAGLRRALRCSREPIVEHLARPEFLRMLMGAEALVGNSSAGLIEAAALRVPCINIGPRQAGRQQAANVVNCEYGVANVRRALARATRLPLGRMRHPYGDGHAGRRIARLLARLDLSRLPIRKRNTY